MQVNDAIIARAKAVVGSTPVRAAGYRLKIFLLEAEKGLEAGEKAVAPTLAKLGFETKSDNQKAREDKGSDMAIVVDVGPAAFKGGNTGNVEWVKAGQVIRILRYAGHRIEEPPGSGLMYGLVNDEDVLGVYDANVMEESNG